MRANGMAVGGDRQCLYIVEQLLMIDVFRGGDHEQRRTSGGENKPSYPVATIDVAALYTFSSVNCKDHAKN